MKRCCRCKEWKPFGEFHKNSTKPDGHSARCKICSSEYSKAYYSTHKEYLNSRYMNSDEATRERRKEASRQWYIENKEKRIAQSLQWQADNLQRAKAAQKRYSKRKADNKRLRKYNVSRAGFEYLKDQQGKVCAICKASFESLNRVCIDHCHTTEVVRGILCSHCNSGLGFFRDNAQFLSAAITYLKTPPPELPSEQERLFGEGTA